MPLPAIKTYIHFSLQDFMREVTERKKKRKRNRLKTSLFFFVVIVGLYSGLA